jgi:hypothetical protein
MRRPEFSKFVATGRLAALGGRWWSWKSRNEFDRESYLP